MQEHDLFRATVRRFLEEHAKAHHARWEDQDYVDDDVRLRAGGQGLLLPAVSTDDAAAARTNR